MSSAVLTAKRQTSVGENAFSLPMVLGSLLVCLTFCFCSMTFSDPDSWWHLKLGQEIWQSHVIPRADHWSFTVYGNPWIPHEWLAQVSIYLAYLMGGYQGLLLWLCVLASALVGVVYTLCYRYCEDATTAVLGGLVAFFFGSIGFAVRPHMIGYLLLAVELLLMERAWSGRPRDLWWLPPMFLLWVNCHGSYALGLGIFAFAVFCSYVYYRRRGVWRGPDARLLVKVLALSVLALIVNPMGVGLLVYPLNVFVKQRASLGFVTEWLPLTVQDVRGIGMFIVLAGMGIAGLRNRARASAFELMILIPVSFLAIQHIRMLFVFGIVAAPAVCRIVTQLRPYRRPKPDHVPSNAVLIALGLACCYLAFPGAPKIEAKIEAQNPVKAIEFIRQSGLKGPMMNDYIWGGYLIWALPEHKIFIDGRGDVFDWAGVLARYRDWAMVQADPARLLDDYHVNFCLLPVSALESNVLPHLRGWKKVYGDDVAVVFARE